jgi:signal transduction histidine kinase
MNSITQESAYALPHEDPSCGLLDHARVRAAHLASHAEACRTERRMRFMEEVLPIITADRVQLQQVVLNLIINAVQAMGAVSQGLDRC